MADSPGWRGRGSYGGVLRAGQASRKIYTSSAAFAASPGDGARAGVQEYGGMAGLAMILFIALFAYGGKYFGWSDPQGWVQLSLVSAFIFGIICGFRVKD
ncbi:MAG: hypothetical protein V4475_03620 [Pseudomonadota bacterium]